MRSIRQRLALLVLSGVVVVWAYSLVSSYRQAIHEAEEWDDTRVEQIARAFVALDAADLPVFADIALGSAEDRDGDNDESPRMLYQVSDTGGRILAASPGLESLDLPVFPAAASSPSRFDNPKWHAYVLTDATRGRSVRIFEQRTHRSDLSAEVARRIARPLAFALPVLAVLIWLAIGHSLTPLRTLSEAIDARSPDSLDAIGTKDIPDEVRPLVAALNALLLRLRGSLDRERAFTSDAAHELKTPLAALKVQAQVALTARDPARQRRAMQRVVEGVDRSTHLADQLLALARLDEAVPMPGEDVDLARTVQTCIDDHRANAERKGVSLVSCVDGPVVAHAPPTLMRVLLDNLVDNAIKYGREQGCIEIRSSQDGGVISIRVQDDGPGVPEEDLSRLQDRFFRGADHDESGSGLGLSIVARIVVKLGGNLTYIDGLNGGGFGVHVTLPLPA
ncbi:MULTISPECIES: ATP-binding protein [Burkholderia cepacia complex]|uniref:ATP-binding protein n=1 Tax=Burkholderia cepacia complex TaxID=87882 RepID=UPI001B91C197|nr:MULTISPECIES: ATP-binding protein [Burkholderia cepacia complex]MBR7965239.1 sensor histidine kinase N-terminal domain-containing protein [Burkholderia cenocepacia]MBR8115423.1 sensor histidine kinase N-terminal domain-containing protein [Burkholderia cenocepacia]MBR8368067.1 sensor histidine kinase N-terminal domain-containing protein [Burkholderia cenocepacia]MBR8386872.1 sensor histidine kinase N-terminal domain-containing protein [Burkholderia cenocepacia]MBR8404928.1 sensor histidine k